MTAHERHRHVLALLAEHPGIKVPELARLLGVSQPTVRSDLRALEQQGFVTRVRGGASLNGRYPHLHTAFASRSRVNIAAKQRIARWAADTVEDGDSIFLDSSTTVFQMAPFLHRVRNLTVVTNGLEVAHALAGNPTHTIILVGGALRADGLAVVGPLSEKTLDELHVRKAFVSCSGLSTRPGLTEIWVEEARLKSKVFQVADERIVLADASKLGRVDFIPFASIDQMTHLVTDSNAPPALLEEIRRAGHSITVCGETTVSSLAPYQTDVTHYRIGFANMSEEIPFCVDVRHGLEQAVQAAGNIDLIVADNQLSGEVALSVADRLLARGVDLVIEYQLDDRVNSLIAAKFQQAGIPIIAVDDPIVGATYFGVDNYRAGYMAGQALGQWVKTHWDGQPDYLLVLEEPRVASLTAARILGQLCGFQEVTGELPESRIIRLESGNTSETSEANTTQALVSLKDCHRLAFITFNDDAAVGALMAARKLGREQDIVVVGQGADRRGRAEIRRPGSRLIGSTAFMPELYGEKLVRLALDILAGKCVPPAVYMDHVFLDRNNIDQYYPE